MGVGEGDFGEGGFAYLSRAEEEDCGEFLG